MSQTVQMFRLSPAALGAYTGPLGQLVVNTTTLGIHVQDGVNVGGSATLMGGNNLSDLPDKAQARSNLALGTAATMASTAFDPAGAATAALAAANAATSAYVPTVALLKANNLSDLANVATARGNLALGNANNVQFAKVGVGGPTFGSDFLTVYGGVNFQGDMFGTNIVLAPAGGGTLICRSFGQDGLYSSQGLITQDTNGITMRVISAGVFLGNGLNSWVAASSVKYKKNIIPLPDGAVGRIGKMAKVMFNYNEDADGTPLRVGSIYENALEVMPYVTSFRPAAILREIGKDADGNDIEHVKEIEEHKGMSLELCVPDIMKAIDELAAENAAMRAEIALLKRAK